MEFHINKFADEFKKTIDWMLNDCHAQELKDDLLSFQKNKNILETKPYPIEALSMIVELIKTNSLHSKTSENFRKKMKDFRRKYKDEYDENFRTQKVKDELIEIVGKRKQRNIERLFECLESENLTLKKFTDKLYELAKQGKTEVLGPKGRDNYLRDFGYWDRIPIDIHEKRFIIRSGIYHSCSSKQQSDPLDKDDLQDALTRFCKTYLKGFKVYLKDKEEEIEIELGSAPGIVDIFIWSFSAEDRYNICGDTPKCDECKLKGVCLYALTNSQ